MRPIVLTGAADTRGVSDGFGAIRHPLRLCVYGVPEERTPVATTKKLVIVESPTKMKSIAGYLGDDYEVLSSVGHIRDLIEPKNLPADKKVGSLGKFSVDVENGFEPYYVVDADKKKKVTELRRALKDADELLLATDEDQIGRASCRERV